MNQLLRQILVLLLLVWVSKLYGQSLDRLDIRGYLELQAFGNNSSLSWYSGGLGKLRYDAGSFPVQLGVAGIHADLHLSDTLWVRTLTTAYTDPNFDPNLVEAYIQYRPVPTGPIRYRIKAGAFHLPISEENTGIAWTSLYSTTPSVINAWVAEELRVIGGEIQVDLPGRFRRSPHDFSISGGLYGFNDGAGTIIAYRGWAQQDRQTGIEDKLRLIPDLEAGRLFREFNPYWEIDDRVGYYIKGTWSYAQLVKLSYMHYDNRADPTARKGFQLAWETRFDHLGITIELPYETRIISQYISGDTFIDNTNSNTQSLTDYKAWYILLSQRIGKHRISARYENFEVIDLDDLKSTVHNSNETGWSWMVSYRHQINNNVQAGIEWIQIHSHKAARLLTEGFAKEKENQLLASIKYRF